MGIFLIVQGGSMVDLEEIVEESTAFGDRDDSGDD